MLTNLELSSYSQLSYPQCERLIGSVMQLLDPHKTLTINILDTDKPNAAAFYRRIIQIDIALIRRAYENKEERHNLTHLIAFVIAHEIGHIELGHVTEDPQWYHKIANLITALALSILNVLTGFLLLKLMNMRQCQRELDADAYALDLLQEKGIDPHYGIYVHQIFLHTRPQKRNLGQKVYHFFAHDHPPMDERIEFCKNHIEKSSRCKSNVSLHPSMH